MRSQEKGEKSEAPLDLPADVKSGNLETAPKKVDLLIVGAGLSGAVIAERASKEQAPRAARSRSPLISYRRARRPPPTASTLDTRHMCMCMVARRVLRPSSAHLRERLSAAGSAAARVPRRRPCLRA